MIVEKIRIQEERGGGERGEGRGREGRRVKRMREGSDSLMCSLTQYTYIELEELRVLLTLSFLLCTCRY